MNNGVIVIGGHVQGLGILRIYGGLELPVVLIDDTSFNLARFSKYCVKFHKYKKGQLLSKLRSFIKFNVYRNWLIIPTNDADVFTLSKNYKELNYHFKVGSDQWEVVKTFYNKIYTYKLCEQLSIPYPKSYYPGTLGDLNEMDIEFPCIIKPAVMHIFYSRLGRKVLICNNRQELISNYNKAIKVIDSNEIIIQEIIPGGSENLYSGCFLFNKKIPIVYLGARRNRQHPLDFGNATTSAETVNIDYLFQTGKKLLSTLEYTGICEVEYKFDDRDHIYKLLEVNPRTWKWHYISVASNSPFLEQFYNLMNSRKVISSLTYFNASWKHIITDSYVKIVLLLRGKKSHRNNYKNTITAVASIEDPLPFIMELILLPYMIFKRG